MSKITNFLKNYRFAQRPKLVQKYGISKEYWSDNNFGFIVNEHGVLYALGENDCGQLGLGHNDGIANEVKVDELSGLNIVAIYEGNCCMFAQTIDGYIYSWGSNKWHQLGNADSNEQGKFYKPKKMQFIFNNEELPIVDIKCGSLHNLALSINGKVFGWGNNQARQVIEDVHGNWPFVSKAVLMTPELTIKSIYCFDKTSFMITNNNEVYYYGRDIWGIRPDLTKNDNIAQHAYIPQMQLNFNAEALICNDDFIFYLTIHSTNSNKLELYKYRDYQGEKLVEEELPETTRLDDDKMMRQSYADYSSSDPISTKQFNFNEDTKFHHSISFPTELCALGGMSSLRVQKITMPKKVTTSDSTFRTNQSKSLKVEKPFKDIKDNTEDNKFSKLIRILEDIQHELEERKIFIYNGTKTLIMDNFAINLSPCSRLWDEAYEIIDNDDYDDFSYPIFIEQVPKDVQ